MIETLRCLTKALKSRRIFANLRFLCRDRKLPAVKQGSTMRISGIVLLLFLMAGCAVRAEKEDRPPNVILFFADDLGYGDLSSYGADFETPNLDRLADEGIRFTDFFIPANVCTPSRASLLTGKYPMRVGLPGVLFPRSTTGLNPEETTLAEVLKSAGYATFAVGKWHLGDHPTFLPTNHGFDRYFGIPYSNDMSPDPKNNRSANARRYPPLPLIEDTTVVEREPDQAFLTRRFTDSTIAFIEEHRSEPFFVYYASPFPHVPIYASPDYRGRSTGGLYGDVVMELDGSVGEIMDVLERLDLQENTLVIFTSDNGPWLVFGDHAGSPGPLREGKMTTFEGGHRVPFIARWPKAIPEGRVSEELITLMDLLPTLAQFAGAELPVDADVDGRDIGAILRGEEGARSPHKAVFYYRSADLQAVRSGDWKLHIPHPYTSVEEGTRGSGGAGGRSARLDLELSLFNLKDDPGERTNVADQYPEVVERLLSLLDSARVELGDSATGTVGVAVRAAGEVDAPWAVQQ